MTAALLALALCSQIPDDLLTVAERSGFKATARHTEVVGLCDRLAQAFPKVVRRGSLGRSGEDRELPLLVVADPPVRTADEAKASGKLVVFLMGNIHAGEVCGKEALPILVREVAATPDHPLLRHLILAVAPIYNADGNERVGKDNRPGQVGPEEGMGQRPNAAGLDLNRDFMKLEAPETRALVRFLDEWDPALLVDTHTTNGSHHRYTLTYEGPKNPAGDPRLVAFGRTAMLPSIGGVVEGRTGFKSFFYGNFEGDHSRWTTYPATPRYGTTYVGLRNRLSVLTEAYSYAPYEDRVRVTRAFCLATLEFLVEHRDQVRQLLDDARRARPRQVAIRSEVRAFPDRVPVLGFVERVEGNRSVATAEPRDYRCLIEQDFAPTVTVDRPFAYVLPPDRPRLVDLVRAHGIAVDALTAPAQVEVAVEEIDTINRGRRPFEKHLLVDVAAVTPRSEPRDLPVGTLVVRTDQPLGTLACYLLEPRSDDGVATWDLLGDDVATDRDFPITKIMQDQALATTPAP